MYDYRLALHTVSIYILGMELSVICFRVLLTICFIFRVDTELVTVTLVPMQ